MNERRTSERSWVGRVRWRPLHLVFLGIGLGLLALLLYRVGPEAVLAEAMRVGWLFPLLVALYGGVHLLRAISWRLCLREQGRHLPLRSALSLWIAGVAVSHLSFAWSGEAFRVAATRERIPAERGISALVVSRVFYVYASLLVMTLSFFLCLFLLRLGVVVQAVLLTSGLILTAICLLPFAHGGRRNRSPERRGETAGQRAPQSALGQLQSFLRTLEKNLVEVFIQDRRAFARLLVVNLLATLAGVVEVFLILKALGVAVDVPTAWGIEGLGKILAVFALFVPGNVGTREGGMVLILGLFSLSATLGVTLVLVRRARALVWVAIGGVLILLQGLSGLAAGASAIEANPDDKTA